MSELCRGGGRCAGLICCHDQRLVSSSQVSLLSIACPSPPPNISSLLILPSHDNMASWRGAGAEPEAAWRVQFRPSQLQRPPPLPVPPNSTSSPATGS